METINLLPNKCKKIGLFIVLSALIAGIVKKIAFDNYEIAYGKHIANCVALIGLLLIICSQQKVETDHTNIIRLKSCFSTFFYVVLFVMVQPLYETKMASNVTNALFTLVVFYIITFYDKLYNLSGKFLKPKKQSD